LYLIDLAQLSAIETAKVQDFFGRPLNYRAIHMEPGFTDNISGIFDRRRLPIAMRWENRNFAGDFFRINEHRGRREWTLIVIFDHRWVGFFLVKPIEKTTIPINVLEITWPAEDAVLRIETSLTRDIVPQIALHIGTSTLIQQISPT
jgi:hypothetical protein